MSFYITEEEAFELLNGKPLTEAPGDEGEEVQEEDQGDEEPVEEETGESEDTEEGEEIDDGGEDTGEDMDEESSDPVPEPPKDLTAIFDQETLRISNIFAKFRVMRNVFEELRKDMEKIRSIDYLNNIANQLIINLTDLITITDNILGTDFDKKRYATYLNTYIYLKGSLVTLESATQAMYKQFISESKK